MIRQSSPGLGPNQLTSERYSKAAGVCVFGEEGGGGDKKKQSNTLLQGSTLRWRCHMKTDAHNDGKM